MLIKAFLISLFSSTALTASGSFNYIELGEDWGNTAANNLCKFG